MQKIIDLDHIKYWLIFTLTTQSSCIIIKRPSGAQRLGITVDKKTIRTVLFLEGKK
jgi:hypothetical protein